MKIKKSILTIFLSTLIISAIISSCKKDPAVDTDTTVASDCYISENYFCDVKNIVDEAGFKNGAYTGVLNDSTITVQFDTLNSSNPDTITINFGVFNTNCADGRVRKGKIITIYNGHYSDTAKVHTITFNNYFVDNTQLTGTIKDIYKGYNSTGHLYFKDTVNGTVAYTSGKTVIWNAASILAYTAGDSTSAWNDNKMIINGTAYGSSSDALTFSTLISTPLLRSFADGCRKYLIQGVMQIAPYGETTRASDFGTGNCDGIINVMIDGKSYQVNND